MNPEKVTGSNGTDESARERAEAERREDEVPARAQARGKAGDVEADSRARELTGLTQERDRLLDQLKRAKADLINYQKRVERDMQEVRRFALQKFVSEVLSVVDDFDRALVAAEVSRDFDVLLQGVRLMESRLKKLLWDVGVTPIEAKGNPFDPHLHEAVLQEETSEVPANIVLDELQRGYRIHERVLRPARVTVSKAPEEDEEGPGEPEDREAPEFD